MTFVATHNRSVTYGGFACWRVVCPAFGLALRLAGLVLGCARSTAGECVDASRSQHARKHAHILRLHSNAQCGRHASAVLPSVASNAPCGRQYVHWLCASTMFQSVPTLAWPGLANEHHVTSHIIRARTHVQRRCCYERWLCALMRTLMVAPGKPACLTGPAFDTMHRVAVMITPSFVCPRACLPAQGTQTCFFFCDPAFRSALVALCPVRVTTGTRRAVSPGSSFWLALRFSFRCAFCLRAALRPTRSGESRALFSLRDRSCCALTLKS